VLFCAPICWERLPGSRSRGAKGRPRRWPRGQRRRPLRWHRPWLSEVFSKTGNPRAPHPVAWRHDLHHHFDACGKTNGADPRPTPAILHPRPMISGWTRLPRSNGSNRSSANTIWMVSFSSTAWGARSTARASRAMRAASHRSIRSDAKKTAGRSQRGAN